MSPVANATTELADLRVQSGLTAWARARLVREAVLQQRQGGYWLALADPGPWPDEDHPPPLPAGLLALENVRFSVRLQRVSAVCPDEAGELETPHGRWRALDGLSEELLAVQGVRWVYFGCEFTLPVDVEVRALGLYRGPAEGGGVLEWAAFRRRVGLRAGQTCRFSLVREL